MLDFFREVPSRRKSSRMIFLRPNSISGRLLKISVRDSDVIVEIATSRIFVRDVISRMKRSQSRNLNALCALREKKEGKSKFAENENSE